MFAQWGERVARRRRWVLAGGLAFVAFAALWGTGVFGSLVSGGDDTPHSGSAEAKALLQHDIGSTSTDLVVLFSNPTKTVDDPGYRQTVDAALTKLPAGKVAAVHTYWTTHSPNLVSHDRHSTYAAVSLNDPDTGIELAKYNPVRQALAGTGYKVSFGGPNAVNADITDRVTHDIARAEMISMPVLLVLLVFVFGSVAAALLPLAVGGIAILGAFTSLRLISQFTDVSIFSINIVTIAGLGLAIDYGLFIVSRFREEMRRGLPVPEAVARTMGTAGRTVVVSAVTVAIALSSLTLFPQVFLRSMGFGGVAAVLVAALAAMTVQPALLAVLGPRVDAWSVRPLLRRIGIGRRPHVTDESGFWYRLASAVMRRPVAFLVPIVAGLLLLGAPFLGVKFGGVDARVLPTSAESRQTADLLASEFPPNGASPITAAVSLAEPVNSAGGKAALASYLRQVRALPGVTGADVTASRGETARVDLRYNGRSLDPATKTLVRDVRVMPLPSGVDQAKVGGETAELVDRLNSLGSRLPWMALMVGMATFVLLFLAFGSVVLPIKAILTNILSLAASFGAITWIFQEGHLSNPLNFTSMGTVDATQPILVLAIVFGLSMDYEVFLLSRVREQYDLTGDNTRAVATGLQRTGRIITSAAILLIVVVVLFSASSVSFIKLIGVAMVIGLIIDATIVRSMLVPATMRLLGRVNWWVPRPLRGVYGRYGITEREVMPIAAPEPARV